MLHQIGTPFRCPNCQKSLQFKTIAANRLICNSCWNINYRAGISDSVGPFAEAVKEVLSVIQIGSTGLFSEKPFEVIGRIQYFFKDSYRNHWHIAFEGGESGWLGDWAGNYSIFKEITGRYTNRFLRAEAGKNIELNSATYQVEMLDEHRLTFFEGEIRDYYLSEKNFITLFLTQTTGAMALANVYLKKDNTNKKQTTGLEMYAGNYVELSDLKLENLRLHDD